MNGFADDGKSSYPTPYPVLTWLTENGVKSSRARSAKLENRRMQQLVTSLKVFGTLEGARSKPTVDGLRALFESLEASVLGYGSQNAFVSYLSFLVKVVDIVL